MRRALRILSQWAMNVLIALDQLGNALLGGDPDETISSRLGKAQERGSGYGAWLRKILDWIDKDHCAEAIERDEGKRQIRL